MRLDKVDMYSVLGTFGNAIRAEECPAVGPGKRPELVPKTDDGTSRGLQPTRSDANRNIHDSLAP